MVRKLKALAADPTGAADILSAKQAGEAAARIAAHEQKGLTSCQKQAGVTSDDDEAAAKLKRSKKAVENKNTAAGVTSADDEAGQRRSSV